MNKWPSPEIIARLSLQKFKTLPKTGKPTISEWTVLSTIVQFNSATDEAKVVALGAGTKCIGQSKLCPLGLILNDSHGEILARRAFLRYLIHQLDSGDGIFQFISEKSVFCIKESITFHFFSTQVPCGDACIASDHVDEIPVKRRRLISDDSDVGAVLTSSVFTGAKLIGNGSSDLMEQTIGALRIKPGRGDRTLSMSCSDKLSKWNVLGIQGALLDSFLSSPIYLETMTFSCTFDEGALKRAIYERWGNRIPKTKTITPHKPEIRAINDLTFEHSQDDRKNPSPNGLVWCDVPEEYCPYEVSVNGKKQGVTKKALHTIKSSLRISKANILKEFCDLLDKHPTIMQKLNLNKEELRKQIYRDLKNASKRYQDAWMLVKQSYFQHWTTKPHHLLDFSVDSSNKRE